MEIPHLAEQHVCSAVNYVAHHHRALIAIEAQMLAHPVPYNPADQQSDARATPDDADARRSTVKNDLAEQAEQDLRRATAGGPADADQGDAEDQRMRAHVAQPFVVFMPGPHDVGFGERVALRTKGVAWQKQP